ncbi:MAG: hypothetical protein ISS57_14400 [Anaerolineales bacterium]|nr:hypothetical protein [Anaerolineales bacterium]
MNKNILTLTIISFVLILTACGNTTPEAGESSEPEIQDFSMPLEMQLMIGTVNLDETDFAIDAAQAAELLPYWKALRSLSESETAASEEIEAVVNQIQASMNSEQIETIKAMGLSMGDLSDLREALGIEGGFGSFGDLSPEMGATMEAARESGQGPGGGIPGAGQEPGGGQEISPEARQTAIAERGGGRGAGIGLNTAFLNGIIEFLEAKTQ